MPYVGQPELSLFGGISIYGFIISNAGFSMLDYVSGTRAIKSIALIPPAHSNVRSEMADADTSLRRLCMAGTFIEP